MPEHYCDVLDTNPEGWWRAHCACGWGSIPLPAADDAADAYADHRIEVLNASLEV